MSVDTFAFIRMLARASLFFLLIISLLVSSTPMAAQMTRELKEVKVAYPPSMAS